MIRLSSISPGNLISLKLQENINGVSEKKIRGTYHSYFCRFNTLSNLRQYKFDIT